MADNVLLPATGTGTASVTQATDDVAGIHYPKVKLVDGTADSGTAIPGDATNGLDVDVTRVQGTVTVDATDLDIRNLVQATDSVKVGDGTNLIDVDVAPTDGETNGGKRLLHTEAWLWGYNGTTWDRLRSDTTNGLDVDVTRVGGTVQVQSNSSNIATETTASAVKTAVELIDDTVKVDDASFTVASDKVVMAGKQAVAHGSNPDAADAGDAVVGIANRHRVPFMIGGHPNIITVSASYTGTQADTAIVSVNAGTKIVLTSLGIYADGGGTGPLDVQVAFGASTVDTVKAIIDHPGIVKGSGVVLGNGAGIIGIGGDGEDLRIDATGFGSGDELTVCASYYTIES